MNKRYLSPFEIVFILVVAAGMSIFTIWMGKRACSPFAETESIEELQRVVDYIGVVYSLDTEWTNNEPSFTGKASFVLYDKTEKIIIAIYSDGIWMCHIEISYEEKGLFEKVIEINDIYIACENPTQEIYVEVNFYKSGTAYRSTLSVELFCEYLSRLDVMQIHGLLFEWFPKILTQHV